MIISIIILLIIFTHIYLYRKFPNPQKLKHQHYDVCIVLGSPTQDNGEISEIQEKRMNIAIDLYQKHYTNTLLISGSNVTNSFIESETMGKFALQHGIKINHLILEKKAKNTYENLLYAKTICQKLSFKKILVVTSNFHCQRASFFVEKFFDDYVMIPTKEKITLHSRIDEYFRLWNTLYYEWKLNHKKP